MRNRYAEERDKLIPEAARRTAVACNIMTGRMDKIPTEHIPEFFHQMDMLVEEHWLVSRKGIKVDSENLRQFLAKHSLLPSSAGKIVINCGPKSVGAVDYVAA